MTPHAPRERGRANLLRGYEIAIADNLGPGWTATDVARWVNYHGGTFNNTMGEGVTHLLATPEQFKQRLPAVKAALALKAVHIVTADWLEDTLEKRRCQKEREYSLREVLKDENARKKREEKAQKGIEEGERFVNTNLYHVYRDEEYFPYEITITRDDEATGNIGQKYILYLWESNPKPNLYLFAAKFYKKHRDNRPMIFRPYETAGLFERGLGDFKAFFRKKTGIHWDERIAKQGTTRANKFQYQPPTGGKPVGVISSLPDTSIKHPEFPSLPDTSNESSSTPVEPTLSKPDLEVASTSTTDEQQQQQQTPSLLALPDNDPRTGTKRGPDSELALPTSKKQKMTDPVEEDKNSAIDNLAKLLGVKRERQGADYRRVQDIPVVANDKNDSANKSQAPVEQ